MLVAKNAEILYNTFSMSDQNKTQIIKKIIEKLDDITLRFKKLVRHNQEEQSHIQDEAEIKKLLDQLK